MKRERESERERERESHSHIVLFFSEHTKKKKIKRRKNCIYTDISLNKIVLNQKGIYIYI